MKKLLFVALVLCLLAACGGEPTPTPDLVATQIAVEDAAHATMTARPPTATSTPEPTPVPTITLTPRPTVTPPPDIEAEEYAVLSALIQQNPIGYDLGSLIVIREQTASGDDNMFEQSVKEAPDLPAGLADSWRSRNVSSYTLDPELDMALDYVLMPQDEFERIFGHVRPVAEDWSDFDAAYPGASGLVVFSRVGFSATGDRALALMGYRCHGLCGAGGLYLLVKEDGDWKVQGALYEWMS